MTPSPDDWAKELANKISVYIQEERDTELTLEITAALIGARNEALEEAAKMADAYAARNTVVTENHDLLWISTYHRIAGENISRDIRALKDRK